MPNNKRKVTLIVSKDKNPKVELKPGMRLDVVAIKLMDPKSKKPGKVGARLCSGGGTCLALLDVDPAADPSPEVAG
jgi:hypothetical protein